MLIGCVNVVFMVLIGFIYYSKADVAQPSPVNRPQINDDDADANTPNATCTNGGDSDANRDPTTPKSTASCS